MTILLRVCVALFQQNILPSVKANSTDVNRLLEQVRTVLVVTIVRKVSVQPSVHRLL